jgi:hypothetical protein
MTENQQDNQPQQPQQQPQKQDLRQKNYPHLKRYPYAVDGHPERAKIIEAILAGIPVRQIAQSIGPPPISHHAIAKYRRDVVVPTLKNSSVLSKVLHFQGVNPVECLQDRGERELARAALVSDPVMERLRQRAAERERLMAIAEAKEDIRGWAAVDRNDLTALELEAKLTGRLEAGSGGNPVQIVVPVTVNVSDNVEGGAVEIG